jgi:hypothetical protein
MSPRSWNRREFSVTPNGYFTILRPSGWFSAARLPEGFRYRMGLSEETEFSHVHEDPTVAPPPEQKVLNAVSQETAILSQTMKMSTHDYHLVRIALIILAATAITWMILWSMFIH